MEYKFGEKYIKKYNSFHISVVKKFRNSVLILSYIKTCYIALLNLFQFLNKYLTMSRQKKMQQCIIVQAFTFAFVLINIISVTM